MKILKIIGYMLGSLALLLLAGFLTAAWIYRDIPAETLEARYTNEHSRFINIDGVRIHYRDEGEGPVVLLLHANFSNLIGWDPWVEALKDSYRVVRMDFTSHGLTGPDPTGDYTQERTLELVEKFIDAMNLGNLSIAGTSMGGTMAIHYSHKYPERIDNLILLSPGSLEGKEHDGKARQAAAGRLYPDLDPAARACPSSCCAPVLATTRN